MPCFTDPLGHAFELTAPARRIVSLVPSQTELLFYLGAGPQVVGRTKFCIHPAPAVRAVPVVGGTKNAPVARILAQQPDLVLANQEENLRETVEALRPHVPVWTSQIDALPQALHMIGAVGQLTGRGAAAQQLGAELTAAFAALPPGPARRVLYLIWREPYLAAGPGTFIGDMLARAGWQNVLPAAAGRYPVVAPEQWAALAPEWVLLSSEPFPFKAKHLAEVAAFCPPAQVRLVDGELFSWYGSRLLHTPGYLRALAASASAVS
ncbi:MAG: helical backbone metal receptor [Bernardetiaceae bacterium]|jgi:ABC-type Fe3+-hydroxamate transport system substrate-binding protein|nr:helical backbone metal receptor [Bernardetiaceae bacterium]